MRTTRQGHRHPLLLYRRTMDRIWPYTLVLGLLLLAAYLFALVDKSAWLNISSDVLLLVGAVVALILCAFAFVSRFMAYVQVFSDHLRLVTPFLRTNISFRRVRSIHPVLMQQLFPPKESKWAQRRFLEAFYGKTVVVVELRSYPMDPSMLKLFLPTAMFSPQATGLVFVVPDWMKFSTELDSMFGTWLQVQRNQARSQTVSQWDVR
ncbi:MAG: hypothetical protein JXB15_00135 [Anaerolineales bacterium]|nr:hypothetical protein [Anaerolineales bacterium]